MQTCTLLVPFLRQEKNFAKEQTIRHQTTAMESLNRELKEGLKGFSLVWVIIDDKIGTALQETI